MTVILKSIKAAKQVIKDGGVIAYPTEAIYGLGCDPFNHIAVKKLLALKNRGESQGLIIIISNWEQLAPLIAQITKDQLKNLHDTWPGHTTWTIPKSNLIPSWISGQSNSVAIRMTSHPIAQKLCRESPIVSTSVNITGEPPAKTINDINPKIKNRLDAMLDGSIGGEISPSSIMDLVSGIKLR